jgi:predicted small lipoprotein YifL
MKKFIKTIFVSSLLVSLASCSVSGPLMITDNPGGPDAKTGESSYSVILGFITPKDADASIATAAKNGKITKVSTVDQKITGGLFKTTYSTIVTGE